MTRRVNIALFPVAGIGRRLLPMTKAISKELLPIGGLPLIQYAVNEAIEAGITKFIFVAGHHLPLLRSYFSRDEILEEKLTALGAQEELALLRDLHLENAIYIHQPQSLGLGHAIFCARDAIDEPFAVLLPDDLLIATPSVLSQMCLEWEKAGGRNQMVAIETVPKSDCHRYGILDPEGEEGENASTGAMTRQSVKAKAVIEKPKSNPPSDLAMIGRYILDPAIFDILAQTQKGAGGEIQITDAMNQMIETTPLHGFLYQGQRFDCGTKQAFIQTQKHFAAKL